MTYNGHDVTDPNAPLGYQCGDASCSEHGVARFNRPTTTKTITEAQLAEWALSLVDERIEAIVDPWELDYAKRHRAALAAIFAALPTANGRIASSLYYQTLCVNCTHPRSSHFDGLDCGEDCPKNCSEFIWPDTALPEGKRCNCPESGTSGSCPFHDSSTLITGTRPMTAELAVLIVCCVLLVANLVGLVWFAIAHAKYGRDRFEE